MSVTIDGVHVTPLGFHCTHQGRRLAIPALPCPGEGVATMLHILSPGQVQAWYQTPSGGEQITCVKGTLQLAIFDARRNSPTFGQINEFFIGEHNLQMLHLPEGLYLGWKNNAAPPVWIVQFNRGNVDFSPVLPHNSALIPYRW